jgi:hypothetical protein
MNTIVQQIIVTLGIIAPILITQYFTSRKPKVESDAAQETSNADFIRDLALTPEKYEAFRKRISDEVRKDNENIVAEAVSSAIAKERKNTQFEFLNLRAEVKALRHYIINIGAAEGMTEQVESLKAQYLKEMGNE